VEKTKKKRVASWSQFEDLSLFANDFFVLLANEAFVPKDVNLLRFEKGEASPLARLESIILALAEEINDEILQELANEIEDLQFIYQGDKISEFYFQGIGKIGNYISAKGAAAHPNSIKLIVLFFYNLEKIISSSEITEEQAAQRITSDIRKFNSLQYQISQSEQGLTDPDPAVMRSATEILRQLDVALFALDWEVTDESLQRFKEEIVALQSALEQNKPVLVLFQGLHSLSEYLEEKREDAHPETFILLHSFCSAIEQILKADQGTLSRKIIQKIVIDCIERLNTLKMLISDTEESIEKEKDNSTNNGIFWRRNKLMQESSQDNNVSIRALSAGA
jgi:pilus assembly protein FimV